MITPSAEVVFGLVGSCGASTFGGTADLEPLLLFFLDFIGPAAARRRAPAHRSGPGRQPTGQQAACFAEAADGAPPGCAAEAPAESNLVGSAARKPLESRAGGEGGGGGSFYTPLGSRSRWGARELPPGQAPTIGLPLIVLQPLMLLPLSRVSITNLDSLSLKGITRTFKSHCCVHAGHDIVSRPYYFHGRAHLFPGNDINILF